MKLQCCSLLEASLIVELSLLKVGVGQNLVWDIPWQSCHEEPKKWSSVVDGFHLVARCISHFVLNVHHDFMCFWYLLVPFSYLFYCQVCLFHQGDFRRGSPVWVHGKPSSLWSGNSCWASIVKGVGSLCIDQRSLLFAKILYSICGAWPRTSWIWVYYEMFLQYPFSIGAYTNITFSIVYNPALYDLQPVVESEGLCKLGLTFVISNLIKKDFFQCSLSNNVNYFESSSACHTQKG